MSISRRADGERPLLALGCQLSAISSEKAMQDFHNLAVWQGARRLTRTIYELTAHLPTKEQFGLQSQMHRASISVCSNIAEGCGRRGDPEFRRFLAVALGSACELECELILSADLKLKAFLFHRQV